MASWTAPSASARTTSAPICVRRDTYGECERCDAANREDADAEQQPRDLRGQGVLGVHDAQSASVRPLLVDRQQCAVGLVGVVLVGQLSQRDVELCRPLVCRLVREGLVRRGAVLKPIRPSFTLSPRSVRPAVEHERNADYVGFDDEHSRGKSSRSIGRRRHFDGVVAVAVLG